MRQKTTTNFDKNMIEQYEKSTDTGHSNSSHTARPLRLRILTQPTLTLYKQRRRQFTSENFIRGFHTLLRIDQQPPQRARTKKTTYITILKQPQFLIPTTRY